MDPQYVKLVSILTHVMVLKIEAKNVKEALLRQNSINCVQYQVEA